MKAYVLPTESSCNGSCKFCVTRFRHMPQSYLTPELLSKALANLSLDKIEITGGGEPLLNSSISEIIKICSERAKTSMYTNGSLSLPAESERLSLLCVSRHHYSNRRNTEIMGVCSDIYKLKAKINVPIKLSLVLFRSGINSARELRNYIDWAIEQGANSVVARQLFEPLCDGQYKSLYGNEFVSALDIASGLDGDAMFANKVSLEDKIFYDYCGAKLEIELGSCACQSISPVIHSNGRISGWGDFR